MNKMLSFTGVTRGYGVKDKNVHATRRLYPYYLKKGEMRASEIKRSRQGTHQAI